MRVKPPGERAGRHGLGTEFKVATPAVNALGRAARMPIEDGLRMVNRAECGTRRRFPPESIYLPSGSTHAPRSRPAAAHTRQPKIAELATGRRAAWPQARWIPTDNLS